MAFSETAASGSETDPWTERSLHWIARSEADTPKRKKRERRTHPLILTGQNVSLRIEKGALIIKNGFTHYPQKQEELRFFPGDLDTPSRIVLIDGSGLLTFAVIDWCVEQGVTLIRLNWHGQSVVAMGASSTACHPDKVKWQIATASDPEARCRYAGRLLIDKIKAGQRVIAAMFAASKAAQAALDVGDSCIAELQSLRCAKPGTLYQSA